MDSIFPLGLVKFNRLSLDYIKRNDLRQVFQILMADTENRTISDINTLVKILLNIQPIKAINNFSAIYHACRAMYLAKYRQKVFIFQKPQEAECLYLILNGKIGLYKRLDEEHNDEVIFLSEGNCFGSIYSWKYKFLPLTFEEALIAIIPIREINKITVTLSIEREEMIAAVKRSGFCNGVGENLLREASQYFTFNRIPLGTSLINEGEIPKALFLLLKGNVRKQYEIKKVNGQMEVMDRKNLIVNSYSPGDFFPQENLAECLSFSLVSESVCQIIAIPKKALKILGCSWKSESTWKNQWYYEKQLKKERDWRCLKGKILKGTLPDIYK